MPLDTEEVLARLVRLEQAAGLQPLSKYVYSQDVKVGSLIRVKGLWRRVTEVRHVGFVSFTLMHIPGEDTTHREPVGVSVEVKVP